MPGCQVLIEVDAGGWIALADCRFFVDDVTADPVADGVAAGNVPPD